MRIIISPAKKMNMDTDSFPFRNLPQFLPQAEHIYEHLKQMDYGALKALWNCSDSVARLNAERLSTLNLRQNLTPAILAYEGIQYRYMAPHIFTSSELEYIEAHLRILSGLYGLLRPFDGVIPYRLEMQAKLQIGDAKDLYSYWGSLLACRLLEETDCIVNLASKEYSVCISRHLTRNVRLLTCVFGERRNGRIVEKGTLCKMARGEMVRYLAERQSGRPEEIKAFDRLNYRFASEESSRDTYVFIREGEGLEHE